MNNELAHYGVLGMKWGVHRAKTTSSSNKKQSESVNDKTTKRNKPKIKRGKQLGQLKLNDAAVLQYKMAGIAIVNAMFAKDPYYKKMYIESAADRAKLGWYLRDY